MQTIHNKANNQTVIFSIIAVLLFLCYSNTFNVPWQFDDKPNITENKAIQIDNLRPETLWKTLFAKPFEPGAIERPVAFFSFALNWYLGKDNPFGYHLVNLFIHILSAFFLFKTTLLILRSPLQKFTLRDSFFIALLSSVLWAINPVQTQAVTYIVQRMASMAALFFIMSLYHFIRARQSQHLGKISTHACCSMFFFLMALGCKENAITFIPSLLLIEILFLHQKKERFSKIILNLLICLNIIFFVAVCFYIYRHYLSQGFTLPFGDRYFSLQERLLTQPSILLFYLRLLLYPSPTHLSLEHSFPLSTSLLHPWATLPAMLCVMGLIIVGIFNKKNAILRLSILFYFINHLIESTIIPLELIFEHRNYLPSMFLFLPIASGLQSALNYSRLSSKLIYHSLLILIPLLIIIIGIGTYSRNSIWISEESLWADCMRKAPENGRPYARLAEIYGWEKENTIDNKKIALNLLEKSLNGILHLNSFKSAILGNIGKLYVTQGKIDKGIYYYSKSLSSNPEFHISRIDLSQAFSLQGEFEKSLEQSNAIIQYTNNYSKFFNLRAIIFLWLNRPKDSLEDFRQAMRNEHVNKEKYYLQIGVSMTRSGYIKRGKWFLNLARKNTPEDTRTYYFLIENCLLGGDIETAKQYSTLLIDKYSLLTIKKDMTFRNKDFINIPINYNLIKPVILEAALEVATTLNER